MESESDPLTRRPVDLFEKELLKGNSEVHLHTPTKFGEDPSKDRGGDREHTHKRCSNYSMMIWTEGISVSVPACYRLRPKIVISRYILLHLVILCYILVASNQIENDNIMRGFFLSFFLSLSLSLSRS